MDLWDLVAAGLVGLVPALLAGLFIQHLSLKARLLIFSMVALAVVQGAATLVIQPGAVLRDTLLAPILGPRSAAERLAGTYEKQLLTDAVLGPQLKQVLPAEQAQRMFTLASRGMLRLGPDEQDLRVRLMARLLAVAAEPECAALSRGKVTNAGLFALLSRLPEREVTQMQSLWAAAARAEVENRPYQQAGEAVVTAALRELQSHLAPEDAQRFERDFPRLQSAPNPDACWLGKTLYNEVDNLVPPNRDALRQQLSRWE